MFVGRQHELEQLNKAYNSEQFECVVISGRRHIGKTALITEFIADKDAIYFSARELTDKFNRESFIRTVGEHFGETNEFPTDWETSFEMISNGMKDGRMILVLDNYTDACLTNKELGQTINDVIERYFKGSKLFLIISGNHMAALDREILDEKSVLYKHMTMHITLKGLSFEDAASFMKGFNAEDKERLYSCVGGTPLYLLLINNNESVDENIERLFFSRTGFLYNDIATTLQKELIGPAVYNSLLRSIAQCKQKAREILDDTGEESGKMHKYLNVLLSMGILCRDVPDGADPQISRKGVWRFEDNAMRFWYRYVLDNADQIARGNGHRLLALIEE